MLLIESALLSISFLHVKAFICIIGPLAPFGLGCHSMLNPSIWVKLTSSRVGITSNSSSSNAPTCGDEEDEDPPQLERGNLGDDDHDDLAVNDEAQAVDEVDECVLVTTSSANSNNANLPGCCPSPPSHDDPLVMRNQLSATTTAVDVSDPTEGDTFAKGTTNHTCSYTSWKKKLLNEFVNVVLKAHPSKYTRFLEVTTDVLPLVFPTDEPTEMVFLLLRDKENKVQKVRSLNKMIIDLVIDKRLKNTTKMAVHTLPHHQSTQWYTPFLSPLKSTISGLFLKKTLTLMEDTMGFLPLCVKRGGMKM
jgi:hypothetical protein